MPPGLIIPEIPYIDVIKAADWLCQAFGFKKRLQIGNHRFQLSFGNAAIVVIQGNDLGTATIIMISVEDVDAHFEQAVSVGARVINPPADYPFGERQCTVEDIGGHRWTFSQTIADVDPVTWGGTLLAPS
jgi:uncharacterized glyoxalase superfamily protein PhnB